ncbi:DNA helicase [Seiridium cupressi]
MDPLPSEQVKDCLLLLSGDRFIGRKLFYPDENGMSIKLGYETPRFGQPFRTIILQFRREKNDSLQWSGLIDVHLKIYNDDVEFFETEECTVADLESEEFLGASTVGELRKLDRSVWLFLKVKMREGRKAIVSGWPMPYVGPEPDDSWYNMRERIEGICYLDELVDAGIFSCLLQCREQDFEEWQQVVSRYLGQTLPFEPSFGWDEDHFDMVIPEFRRRESVQSQNVFSSKVEAAIYLQQGVAQDQYPLLEDAENMCHEKQSAVFFPDNKNSRDDESFLVSITLNREFSDKYYNCIKRTMTMSQPVGIAFRSGERFSEIGLIWTGRVVGSNQIPATGRPSLKSGEKEIVLLVFRPSDPQLRSWQIRHHTINVNKQLSAGQWRHRDYLKMTPIYLVPNIASAGAISQVCRITQLLMGNDAEIGSANYLTLRHKSKDIGYWGIERQVPSQWAHRLHAEITCAASLLTLQDKPTDLDCHPHVAHLVWATGRILPTYNFLQTTDNSFRDSCLHQLRGSMLAPYTEVLSRAQLGHAALCGDHWDQPLAVTTTVLFDNPTVGRVVLSCSKNAMVAKVANATDAAARKAVDDYNQHIRDKKFHKAYFTVVRSKLPRVEADMVIALLKHKGRDLKCWQKKQDASTNWSLHLSAAEWFLKVVRYTGLNPDIRWDLDRNDNPMLLQIRDHFESSTDPFAVLLRDCLNLKLNWEDLETQFLKAHGKWLCSFDGAVCHDPEILKLKPTSPKDIIVEVMTSIVLHAASALCATPRVSSVDSYAIFNEHVAKATLIGDAGTMRVPELLMVWLYARPLVLAGNLRGRPVVPTRGATDENNNWVNMFVFQLEHSALARHVQLGFASCDLQRRAAEI